MMIKVLWVGDAVVQSGFSVVTHSICDRLNSMFDIVVYGIRYDGLMRHPCGYHIYPAYVGTDIYGRENLTKIISIEQPDVVVLFNDFNIVVSYAQKIFETSKVLMLPMFPVNLLPISEEHLMLMTLYGIKEVLTYTEFASSEINKISPKLKATAVYHGVNRGVYYPIKELKQQSGLGDMFVVGSVGSNTYRKRLDLFLEGFAKFAAGKDNVRCLIHTSKHGTFNIDSIINDLGIANLVIFSQEGLSVSKMNEVYNLMDVNVNTSLGEGFGLPLLEGFAAGVPIVCPDIGNLRDVWEDVANYIKISRTEYVPDSIYKGEVICPNSLADILNNLYDSGVVKNQGTRFVSKSKFNWKDISSKVADVILDVVNSRTNFIV